MYIIIIQHWHVQLLLILRKLAGFLVFVIAAAFAAGGDGAVDLMHILLAAVLVNVAELGSATDGGTGTGHAVGVKVGSVRSVLVRHVVVRDDRAGHHVDLASPLSQSIPETLEVGPALLPPSKDDGWEMIG